MQIFIISRFVHFANLFFILASSLFIVYLAPQPFASELARRLTSYQRFSIIVNFISAIVLSLSQLYQIADSWTDLLHSPIYIAVIATSLGHIYTFQMLGGLIMMLYSNLLIRYQKILWLSSSVVLLSLAYIGHAAMRDDIIGSMQRISQMLHLFSAAYWSGGLIIVIVCLAYTKTERWKHQGVITLMRFSYYGHFAVVVVVVTGIINSWLIVGAIPARFNNYIILLLIKALIVGLMVIVALINRYILVPRFKLTDQELNQKLFVLLTIVELILSLGALALVALFATLTPN